MSIVTSEARELILENDNITKIVLLVARGDTGEVVIRDAHRVRTRQEREITLLEIAVKCLIFRHLPVNAPPVVIVVYPIEAPAE